MKTPRGVTSKKLQFFHVPVILIANTPGREFITRFLFALLFEMTKLAGRPGAWMRENKQER